jgi:hypothetical protein
VGVWSAALGQEVEVEEVEGVEGLSVLPGKQRRHKEQKVSRVPAAHACNLSYSGSSDQKDCSSKPAPANSETLS